MGPSRDRHVPTEIMTQVRLTWVAIAAGDRHSMILGTGGALRVTGYNHHGQVGDGTTTVRLTPKQNLADMKLPTTPSTTTTSSSTTSTTSSTTTTTSSTTTTVPGSSTTTTTAPGPGTGFPDVTPDHPYDTAITQLAGANIISGFEDGSFRPEALVTRQQFAKGIVLAGAYPVSMSDVCPFTDVALQMGSDPLYPSRYVAVCADHGITKGKTATTFGPYSNITRYQVISMVVRAADDLKTGRPGFPPSSWTGVPAWRRSYPRGQRPAGGIQWPRCRS